MKQGIKQNARAAPPRFGSRLLRSSRPALVAIRPLILAFAVAGLLSLVFDVFRSDYNEMIRLPLPGVKVEKELAIASAKEFADLVALLWALLTGIFAVTALAVRDLFKEDRRCPASYAVLLALMVAAAAASLFSGFQVKSAMAQGLLASTVDWISVQRLIGKQALTLVISAATALGLLGDALLRAPPK